MLETSESPVRDGCNVALAKYQLLQSRKCHELDRGHIVKCVVCQVENSQASYSLESCLRDILNIAATQV